MDALVIVLAVLSVWRVVHLIAKEDGPFYVFGRLREFAGVRYASGTEEFVADTMIGNLLLCPLCLSVWFAIPPAVILATGVFQGFICWLGISGGASLLELMYGGGKEE